MGKLTIALDCDDVLFSCNELALNKLNEVYGTCYEKTDIKCWGYTGSLIDSRISFFSDPDFVASQPLLQGARKFIADLKQLPNVDDIIIVTSVPPQCATARFESILRLLPEINPDNIVITACKSCITADYLLDDGVHNLDAAINVKNRVLFCQPWNDYCQKYKKVSTYAEFIDFIEENESNDNQKFIEYVYENASDYIKDLQYWSNSIGQPFYKGKRCIEVDELPSELISAHKTVYSTTENNTDHFLAEYKGQYKIAYCVGFNDEFASDNGLSMDRLFNKLKANAKLMANMDEFKTARIIVAEGMRNSKKIDRNEVTVLLPCDTSKSLLDKVDVILNDVFYLDVK